MRTMNFMMMMIMMMMMMMMRFLSGMIVIKKGTESKNKRRINAYCPAPIKMAG